MGARGRQANPDLTIDEMDALFHVAEGKTAQEVADQHGISRRAVEWRINQLKRKLGARTLPQAISVAYHRGILLVPQKEENGYVGSQRR